MLPISVIRARTQLNDIELRTAVEELLEAKVCSTYTRHIATLSDSETETDSSRSSLPSSNPLNSDAAALRSSHQRR